MKDFKKLLVWQRSIHPDRSIYLIINGFPKTDLNGLSSQIKREPISIPSTIAEGSGRSDKEFFYFLNIAKGSAFEFETHSLLHSNEILLPKKISKN